jgi:hypothetical protein
VPGGWHSGGHGDGGPSRNGSCHRRSRGPRNERARR